MNADPGSDGFPAVKSEIDPESFRDRSLNEDAIALRPYLNVSWLGRIEFAQALALQDEMVARKREDHSMPDELFLLEHEPVYTIGRTPDRSSLSAPGRIRGGELGRTHLPHPLFSINRGGQATYHGPGQLMGYPIIDLRRCGQDLHKYLRWLEQLLIELLAGYDIPARRRESLTGVWVEDRKIASIGVGVRHWITMHGFALNVCGDLSPFDHIVPCGIKNVAITSMEKETSREFSVDEVAAACEKLALHRIAELRIDSASYAAGTECSQLCVIK
jgi:lipoyl(octanoyl) transferase